MNENPLSGLDGLTLRDLDRIGQERLGELVGHVLDEQVTGPLIGNQDPALGAGTAPDEA
ncbi:hypothetical protein EDD29_3759 [Actinocorallia herbida]|uniref:Uncharacterized protein n=1 Tax=Actinocorallia herbida TaxID=58109 RepID=A0A3N1CY67_9ACTN|nr:hypothetical protein [Actinocorallia herbida]ROO86196.1 hypothetical protein EDD29_3759 [Actinocorallia herbida]